MDLKSVTARAKGLLEKRGGTQSAKEDAGELRDIAAGGGSLTDRAQAAAQALKEPGAGDEPVADPTAPGVAAGEQADGGEGRARAERGEGPGGGGKKTRGGRRERRGRG